MPNKNNIYVLYHSYENEFEDLEQKILGFYNSNQKGLEAIKRYSQLEGFKNHKNGFYLEELTLNQDSESWQEGFSHQRWVELEGIPYYGDHDISSVEMYLQKNYDLSEIPKGPGSEYEKLKEWKSYEKK